MWFRNGCLLAVAGGGESSCVVNSRLTSDEDVSLGMRAFGTGEKKNPH